MAQMPTCSFDMIHVPQPYFTTEGWNLPSYGSKPNYSPLEANT
jgi:hypothetical protein